MSSETKLVRIHPFNQRTGRLTRSYTYGGIKFLEKTGWYRVSAALADKLEELYVDDDIHNGTIFEVKTEEDAVRVHERELAAREKASPKNPARAPDSSHKSPRKVQGVTTSAMSTADLRQPKYDVQAVGDLSSAKAPAAEDEEPVVDDSDWGDDLAADNEASKAEVAVEPEPVAAEPSKAAEATKVTRVGPPSRLSKPRG